MLLRVQVTMILGLIIPSCGPSQHRVDQRQFENIQPLVLSPNPPAAFTLADADCQTQTGPATVSQASIWSWNGPQAEAVTVPLAVNFADAQLTRAVNKATVGDIYLRRCDIDLPGGRSCYGVDGQQERWLQQHAGSSLRLCTATAQAAYPRRSAETVMAESLYFVQKAYDFYIQATAKAGVAPPAPINLLVLPDFITDFAHFQQAGKPATVRTYLTDNLAYFPGNGMIGVFPIKASEDGTLRGYFWESAFVLGHEYGHHIDFTRHGHVLASVGLRWEPLTHSYIDELALAAGQSPASDRAQIAGAEAEAFADLLGYYASGGDGRAVVGIPHIGYNRNIKNSQFAGGERKMLTTDHLGVLLGRSGGRFAAVDYSDIHTIGAIIAYSADQVFAALTKATNAVPGSRDELSQRYQLALLFMDGLTKATADLDVNAGGSAVLAPLGTAFAAATSQFNHDFALTDAVSHQLEEQICRMTRTLLPALNEAPFAVGGSC